MSMAAVPASAPPAPDLALAERLFDELRRRTGATRGVTRPSYGLGEQIAHDMLRREAERLGLRVETDAACNLYATLPGQARGPAVAIGSHLDSVPRGGNFDGAAGVLMGLCVIAGFRAAGIVPPLPLMLMAIRAEESAWFSASYIGSRAAFGQLAAEELDSVRRAGDGVSLGAAIAAAGGDPDRLRAGAAHLDPAGLALFVEPHIEQGPVLVQEGLPIGLVTGIRGSFRHRRARCTGTYAHSGATPRAGRHDAVRAVARLIVALDDTWERLAAEGHDLTVTVGQIATDPDEASFSKIAGQATFSLDIRSAEEPTLAVMRAELAALVARIEAREGVRFDLGPETGSAPAAMSPAVLAALGRAADALGLPQRAMACGAGHDAAVFARMGVPTAMIFIRNPNGSHNPDEHMEMADFAAAARLFCRLALAPPVAELR